MRAMAAKARAERAAAPRMKDEDEGAKEREAIRLVEIDTSNGRKELNYRFIDQVMRKSERLFTRWSLYGLIKNLCEVKNIVTSKCKKILFLPNHDFQKNIINYHYQYVPICSRDRQDDARKERNIARNRPDKADRLRRERVR